MSTVLSPKAIQSTRKKILLLSLAFLAIIYVPYIGAYVMKGGNLEKYFDFPPLHAREKPTATITSISINIIVWASFILLLFFPRIYRFKRPPKIEIPKIKKTKLPNWFWVGSIMWVGTMILLFGKFEGPQFLLNWALVPLCWGFVLFLDGLVYIRTGGISLISNAPSEIIAMGVVSISGWLIFEYLNFFIDLNWYYPQAGLVKSDDAFTLYAIFGSSGWIPLAFEWYYLLMSFRRLDNKYKSGPKVRVSHIGNILIILISLIALFAVPFYPNELFYIVWLAPLAILSVVLGMLGIPTPFTNIRETGDWSPLIIFGLAWLFQGLIVEFWNYFSATHLPNGKIICFNPAYWSYCIPFVFDLNVFQMPVLGYIGYAPFGVYCWIWWIYCSEVMNISTTQTIGNNYR